jgi:hypothetical protein
MSYHRQPIGSPCSLCGRPVAEESVAVRTLTGSLPYVPKIWHRPCFELKTQRRAAAPVGAYAEASAAV